MMNLVGEFKSSVLSLADPILNSIYQDVVVSTASERINLIVQTFFGTCILVKSLSTTESNILSGRIKSTLESACALFIYRNAMSLLSLVQLEVYMLFQNESNGARVMANLSSGLSSLLSGNIPEEVIREAYLTAGGILLVLALVKLKNIRAGTFIPLKYYFILSSLCAYLIGLKALLEIGAKVNSPNT